MPVIHQLIQKNNKMMIEVMLQKQDEKCHINSKVIVATRMGFVQIKFIPGSAEQDPGVDDQARTRSTSVAENVNDLRRCHRNG